MKERNEPGLVPVGRLQQAIEQAALRHGLNGDMFDDTQPIIGTWSQQCLLLQILTELPSELTRPLPTLSKTLVSRLILSSAPSHEGHDTSGSFDKSAEGKLLSPVTRERKNATRRIARGAKR